VLPVTRIEHLQCLANTFNVEVVDDNDEDYSEHHIDNEDSEFNNNDDYCILLLINYKQTYHH